MSVQGRDPSPMSAEIQGPVKGERILDVQSARQPRALSIRPGNFPKVPPCSGRASILPRRGGEAVSWPTAPGAFLSQHQLLESRSSSQDSIPDGLCQPATASRAGGSLLELRAALAGVKFTFHDPLRAAARAGCGRGGFLYNGLQGLGGAANHRAGSPVSFSVKFVHVANPMPPRADGCLGNDSLGALPGPSVRPRRDAHVGGGDAHAGKCTRRQQSCTQNSKGQAGTRSEKPRLAGTRRWHSTRSRILG